MADQGIVACGKCQIGLKGPSDSEADDDVFACPECGRSDTRKVVMEEVTAFVTDNAARQLQGSMKDVAKRSTFITFSGSNIPDREYRYIWLPA